MKRLAITAAVFVAILPSFAHAQSKDAEVLFEQGIQLVKDGRVEEACPKFEQSNKIETSVGVLLRLADCYEKLGRTASAFKQFIAAEQLAVTNKDNRDKVAQKHASALEPRLSKLTITLAPGARVDGLAVKLDGDAVKNFGDSIAVDPGSHLIEASAPKYKSWDSKKDVGADGAIATVTIPTLEREPDIIPPPAFSSSSMTGLKIGGLVIAGVGLVGVGVGTVFGFMAKGSLSDSNANNHCDANNFCDQQGLSLRSDAKSSALLSTISFIAGGVLFAGGLTIFLVAPKGGPKEVPVTFVPALSPSFAGLAATSRF